MSPMSPMNQLPLFSLPLLMAWLLPMACNLSAQTLSAVEEGQALAAELRSAQPPERLDVQGHILIRHSDRSRTTQPFWHQVIPGGLSWQLVYQAFPSATAPGQHLVVTLTADQPPRYTLHRQTNDDAQPLEPVTLTGDEAMIPFAGSDFWLADLGLDFLHWPDQRIDRTTRITMRKGRACKVLESRNPRPNAAGYTRVRSWVDNETGAILIAEAYDPDNRRMKEFEIGGFTRIDGRWELKNMEMRNLRDDTRTTLQFTY
jgi:hypothetical protein